MHLPPWWPNHPGVADQDHTQRWPGRSVGPPDAVGDSGDSVVQNEYGPGGWVQNRAPYGRPVLTGPDCIDYDHVCRFKALVQHGRIIPVREPEQFPVISYVARQDSNVVHTPELAWIGCAVPPAAWRSSNMF